MRTLLATSAAIALFTVPVLAADADVNAQSTGGKPSSSANPTTNSAAKNEKAYESTGASTGTTGTSDSKQLPGASDSAKPDSSLSTNGNKMKQ